MTIQARRFCRECGANTLHSKEHFSDGWGCLLSILTGGLFLPLWFIVGIFDSLKPYRCQNCGRAKR